MENQEKPSLVERFTYFSAKIGNQVHLRSLRDAFTTIMPMFILAGLAVLFNNVVFPKFLSGDTLVSFQVWGNVIVNGTLSLASILAAAMISYFLAKNKNFENPIGAVPVSLTVLIAMMAINYSLIPVGAKKAVTVTGILTYQALGTQGMFAGIIIGLVATELYIRLASNRHLQINLGDQVPPAVGKAFSSLIPTLIVVSLFAVLSAILAGFHTDLIAIISKGIQEPLRAVNTSLPGYLLIYSFGNFLFGLGIHQTVINGVLLDPLMLVNMNQNMAAVQAGKAAPNILNSDFTTVYAQMGGTGMTIPLLIAIFIFIKFKPYRDVATLAVAPGIFEINEPIIFGLPIVFNLPMIIPFVLMPVIGALIGYFVTFIGFVKPLAYLVPWTTPPFLSGFIASGGDIKVVLVQVLIIVIGVLFYLPFLKISERVARMQAEQALEN
ncbi:MAG: PTS transporter subunit EIIC [Streptococcaceae bacterium]|jgi:PTS system cellobiose-specific IIC component|nr:PTS transporter subunit EIIC [Streptococcaceae bacterium]